MRHALKLLGIARGWLSVPQSRSSARSLVAHYDHVVHDPTLRFTPESLLPNVQLALGALVLDEECPQRFVIHLLADRPVHLADGVASGDLAKSTLSSRT